MQDTIKKINTARRMPPRVLFGTLTKLAKRKIRKYFIKFHPAKLSDKQFFKLVNHKNLDELPPFFLNLNEKEKIIETIKREYPTTIKEMINTADEICEHIFNLLGSGKTELGKEIDWHLDFKVVSGGIQKHIILEPESMLLWMMIQT